MPVPTGATSPPRAGCPPPAPRRRDPREQEHPVRHISDRALIFACALIVVALCGLTIVANAHSRQVHWQQAGASVFNGPSCHGYRGDYLCGWKWRSFAELQMGTALGGLPHGAKIRVLYQHRKITLVKRDIGLGGHNVGGLPRAIDLWWKAANVLGITGVAVVSWRRVT